MMTASNTHLVVFILATCLGGTWTYDIWPLPQKVHQQDKFLTIDPHNFHITSKINCLLIDQAAKRYQERTFVQDCSKLHESFRGKHIFNEKLEFKSNANHSGELKELMIETNAQCESLPYEQMDESYNITVSENSAVLTSGSVWGVLRGLETFSQMVEHVGLNQFTVHLGQVHDHPRFKHRGVMLDSSRHFLPVHTIKESLDAMEMNKFNVFHWHLTDDQSFPFVSETFPELSAKGAYNNKTHVYQPKEVSDIIEYAAQRGIRVIAEFDSPGHTASWGKGRPELLTQCYNKGKPSHHGPLNPIVDTTYQFVQKFFAEVTRRFPDKFTHLGGDEVDSTCWESNPAIQEFMKKTNRSIKNVESYYIEKLLPIISNLNRSYIVWQEVFDNHDHIMPETIVHVWKGGAAGWENEMKNITSSGYRTLLSSCWYLNYINYGTDWTKYYHCDPQNFGGTEKQKQLVMGGEACIWAEWVDASNLISRLWPRANAVAERLWSDASVNNHQHAASRFHLQRCRMQQLGIRAQPNEGPGFCKCDYAL